MQQKIIEIKNLTKKYNNGYGIFDINLEVNQGDIYGYLGPNGAGKSTTIRHLMGYIRQNKGKALIFNEDCWKHSYKIQPSVGYLPGEINYPEHENGLSYIKFIYKLRKQENWDYVEKLIKYWEFNPNIKIKKMSKGMKQKLGLVLCLMHQPKVLILDEPTTGLDPLIKNKFIQLMLKLKQNNTTIFLSSHVFEEVEKLCNKVAIIKSGRIINKLDLDLIKTTSDREYKITFKNHNIYKNEFLTNVNDLIATYKVPINKVNYFFNELKSYEINLFEEIPFSLENYFLKFYKKEGETK
ncbi:ABC transporter, ATP-binding component [synthetic Mycoplasma mycoides JCVI-syn1.0]|uniref:ABC transporter ATP-binding protein n=1 Tax=Mycoplasma mycoides subsp. capri TaxID=40477 RepID=A0AB38GF48_MYCMC|nr:ABC transporter ATP-binding protein [Mycoplasma mycoides]ADH21684.1 ABC transporter, ATP-binding component [synthetic Mycoplasma mycoides JCVI-syn1.0]ACU78541.1 ABC transporter, ATP-binding component [Mycoplasma mycoides subsp. capri str. GM12]ACU79372.1 ABC transporter, ATP-binding component [Mycoplasma mycoides subsp. capri str. GM12]EXU60703.1 ABC transporter, ATP-binding component [Mycoplasma mycoides subsp. capri PG3]QVJ96080.1 ABC transporter ATP-binding protein [Mycoplasma mycoides s